MAHARLADVAEHAGVSTTTASQVFSGKRPVSADTRRRVLESAAALGYRPKGRTGTIGVLVRPAEAVTSFLAGTTSFSTITGAVTLGLLNAGYTAFVSSSHAELTAIAARLDGAVVLHPNFEDETLHELESRRIPVVAFDRDPSGSSFEWWVGINYFSSFIRLIQHIHATGGDTIGLIIGETDNMYRRSILQAYSALAVSSGNRQLIRVADNDEGVEGARAAATRLLEANPDCNAILTSSSVFAAGAEAAVTRRGLSVPEDVRIASVLDGAPAETAACPITSLRLDTTAIASRVVEVLEERFRDGEPPVVHQCIPLELVVRGSTARAG
ncbi:LacI family DNA-binding transcriptional regulator [Gulosibacter sp. 10]|uniref:LacI family DNA-binding transcriptional regulator n=1 Tax=Gulosibacter sp. 10 TaxID=1255570 RepID=UPI001595BD35|nr:LacI family DNA-binding transcriptional regulator [Gulosibacter sp. 10]